MTEPSSPPIGDVPAYPDVFTYVNDFGSLHVWEGDGWKEESLSWKTGCYLAINLSGPMEVTYSGSGAQEFLSRLSINNVHRWPIGRSKHLVMANEEGMIVSHGLAVRDSEHSFRQLAALPWAAHYARERGTGELDVTVSFRDIFILQIAGPRSLEVIEAVLGTDIRSLEFLATAPITIAGVQLELSRVGMTNGLAYEVRGAYADAPAVYDTVYRAGKHVDIRRLGRRTYPVNHTEGGFPQMSMHFESAAKFDEAYVSRDPARRSPGTPSGSVDPADTRSRMRTPQEVNWAWMAKFDHEFLGRTAIEAEAAAPRRTTVILRWNAEDVLDTFASHLRPGEEYKYIEFPSATAAPSGSHADLVTLDGVPVGVSSAAIYSYHYREMISQCTIDLEHAELGTEVTLHWGDFGGRIKQIRATVARFPYLDLPSNREIDVSSRS